MSDITALVLSIGEETTQSAIDSVKRQTFQPKEIIIIENISPFYKALKSGTSKVNTEFFVQVDSDLILDSDCFERLRRCIGDNVGIVVGHLRDPLIGRACCVKMYRRKCFEMVHLRNSISPDTDFRNDILKYGWTEVHALRFVGNSKKLWHTFGDHKPSYTPHYTYSKYLLEGRRYRHRKNLQGLKWLFKELQKSKHNVSLIAQIAMAHGIFLEEKGDMLKPFTKNSSFDFLEIFLTGTGIYKVKKLNFYLLFSLNTKKTFKKYYKLGINLRKENAFLEFKRCMDVLNKSRDDLAWIAQVGLCHGLFFEKYDDEIFENEYNMLSELIPKHSFPFVLTSKLYNLALQIYDFSTK